MRKAWSVLAVAMFLGLINGGPAEASTGGSAMPWDAPITSVFDSLSGTTAKAIVGIMIVFAGIVWMRGRGEEGGERMMYAVIGGAVIFGIQTLYTAFGWTGALLP